MALDEETSAFLAEMAGSGGKPIHQMSPSEARAMGDGLIAINGSGPDMHSVSEERIATDDGATFAVRILKPASTPSGVLIYFHGGGWVTGSLNEFDTLARELAVKSSSTVILVDYRLAPEHPFPIPLDDALRATRWVAANRQDLTGNPSASITVAGDSSGGNLAAVVAQRSATDATLPIALQVLIYPVVNCDFDTDSYLAPENQLIFDRASMSWFFDHYVPKVEDRRQPAVSPALAPNLDNLPPAVILTAEHDVLRTEVEAYAAALTDAGVSVELRHFPGQMHGFFNIIGISGGQREAVDFVATKVASVNGGTSTF
jgi:acetyl esterase